MFVVESLTTSLIGPVSFELAPGEVLCIQGASGSGKTLLLRALADLDPSGGRVTLGGRLRESFAAPDWRRAVGLVPAESGWWKARVGDHFAATPDPATMLEALGLGASPGWEVARLSSGERQRLALLRALQLSPKVLLLDEPTSALDGAATAAVEALLKERLAEGLALVMVTHDPAQADRMATRHGWLEAGRLEVWP